MTFYEEWKDFINYPKDPNKVFTKEARLDCSKAIRVENFPVSSAEEANKRADLINEFGWVITKDNVIFEDDDEFEVMEITSLKTV